MTADHLTQSSDRVETHGLDEVRLHHAYRTMVMMRLLHDRATALQRTGRIHSWLGCYGQEAAIVGSSLASEPQDWLFPSYREHAAALVRGIPVGKLMDHLFANAIDNAKGRNLPPEYTFREINYVSISAPVGTQVPQAVGTAYAAKLKGDPVAVMAYFGDGTASSGDVLVSLNYAGVWKVPLVLFCQNNGWAISVPTHMQTASPTISARAAAFGFEGVQVDGNDLLATYGVTKRALEKARRGEGPTLIEAMTYRVGPHSTSDDPSAYRDEAEVAPWRDKDPIARYEAQLASLGLWDEAFGKSVRDACHAELLEAAKASEEAGPPEVSTIFDEVYAEMPWHIREQWQAHIGLRQE
ncbi:MAG: thiamine pyrophosphate-dependent dehydrogenase E1 component subunit alpha [Candidatus Sericytochromatia bacterium]|nr:thiamine pyrophosphate-dependent dehydrogenase E1 component subunit alpha [Candidatus Sericytochromatia bacterium]